MGLLPLFPLDVVLFPGASLPLHIFEPRYREMVAECLDHKRPFGMVRAKDSALAEVGCAAVIVNVLKRYEDGRMDISTEGMQRFEIVELNNERSFLQAEVVFFEDAPSQVPKAKQETVVQLHQQLFELLGQESRVEEGRGGLSFYLAHSLPVDLDFKQSLLEMKTELERIDALIEYYRATVPKLERTLLVRERASRNGHIH